MSYRAILIDPYDRTVSEVETDGQIVDFTRFISNDEGDRPCALLDHVTFADGLSGWLDDSGNWTQFAWFALVDDARLFCGRMLITGSTSEGETADVMPGMGSLVMADKVIWLTEHGAIEQAQLYEAAMAESARNSDVPVISLDKGLVDRITEAIENKHAKQAQRLAERSYRSNSGDDPDWKHVGEVLIYETDRCHRLLPPMNEHVNHSPDGFAWGYHGSGPAQLAYAIIWDVTNDLDKTQLLYQNYKAQVIAALDRDDWTITATSVLDWIAANEVRPSTEG